MSKIVNVYCDESSHLPNDGHPYMVLGAIACPLERTVEIAHRIRDIRRKHELPAAFEVKWAKVSSGKLSYYEDLVDYFFSETHLRFRAVVADKRRLNHAGFDQTHDDWYYKMMWQLLSRIQVDGRTKRVYLDKKDTRSGAKVKKLHEILGYGTQIERLQIVESHAVVHMQLADLLLGAVSYANRGLDTNPAKVALIERIEAQAGLRLTASTSPGSLKFNLFRWSGGRA